MVLRWHRNQEGVTVQSSSYRILNEDTKREIEYTYHSEEPMAEIPVRVYKEHQNEEDEGEWEIIVKYREEQTHYDGARFGLLFGPCGGGDSHWWCPKCKEERELIT